MKGSVVVAGDSYSSILNYEINDQCPTCYIKIDDSIKMIECEKCHKKVYCSEGCKKKYEIDHLVYSHIYIILNR